MSTDATSLFFPKKCDMFSPASHYLMGEAILRFLSLAERFLEETEGESSAIDQTACPTQVCPQQAS
jgi:hypothetical protein